MALFSSERLSVGQIFATSFRLWKVVFAKVQLLAFLAFIWGALPYIFLSDLDATRLSMFSNKTVEEVILSVIYLLGLIWFFAAVYRRAYQVLNLQGGGLLNALWIGLKKLLPLIPALIISGVVLTASYLVFLIPGVIVMVILIFYYPLIVVDDLGPLVAFKRCFNLVWGDWVRTAVVVLVPTILFAAVSISIEMGGWGFFSAIYPLSGKSSIYHHLVKLVFGAFYFPFFVTLVLVQLNDLKIRKSLMDPTIA